MNLKSTIGSFIAAFLFVVVVLNPIAVKAEDSKPMFVIISTNWCYACKLLHPVINELESQYSGQVNFLYLDASNEDSINSSRQLAAQYGLAAYFDSNRNVFPKVGILCPGSSIPEKVIIGANNKDTYISAINSFILDPNKICTINGRPSVAVKGPDRPDEPEISEIPEGRPDTPNLSDRPNDLISLDSGRPKELSFWSAGQPIPMYAYYQYLIIPKCSSENNVICSNNTSVSLQDAKGSSGPAFKPYNPNATRDEKGYHF